MTPGPLRDTELADAPQHLRWLNSLRGATGAVESRARVALWTTGPLQGPSGTVALDSTPFRVGAVLMASVQSLGTVVPLTVAPVASFQRLTDGRTLVTYQFLPAGRFQLVLMLVESSDAD